MDYIKSIYNAVLDYDINLVKKLTNEALKVGLDPILIMNEGLSKSILEIGERLFFGKIIH